MKNKKWILLLAILFMFCIGYTYAKTNRISARRGHSAIYDSANKQMLIFGGSGTRGGVLSDLWVYDIEKKKWKEIPSADEAPPARGYHSAIYDSANKQMLIFGGSSQGGVLFDLWAYDIEKKTWKEIETDEAPPARSYYSTIYDTLNKQMLIFGGYGQGGVLSDLWAYDIEKKIWKEIEIDETPPARQQHSAIYDPLNKQMLIFGGLSQAAPLSDLWAYDIEKKTWKEIEIDEAPPARQLHSPIYDSANKQMLIFGGYGQTGASLSDLWAYDIEKKTWKEIKIDEAPPAIYFHSAIYDFANKQMLIFGGVGQAAGQAVPLSSLWAYDIEKKTWEKLKTKSDKDLKN